jgi:carboxymethylenebutenolidase
VPILGLYGGDRLKSRSTKSAIVVYPDAPHAFHADYRSSYRQSEAEDGWKRLQAWFKENGVG